MRVALTPIRVVCNNTLNLALATASRSWSMIHKGNVKDKMQEAKNTLFMAEIYMERLGEEFERLRGMKVTDSQVEEYVEKLLPLEKDATEARGKNTLKLREDIVRRYYDAPDLREVGKNAYRFINAVSDLLLMPSRFARQQIIQRIFLPAQWMVTR